MCLSDTTVIVYNFEGYRFTGNTFRQIKSRASPWKHVGYVLKLFTIDADFIEIHDYLRGINYLNLTPATPPG